MKYFLSAIVSVLFGTSLMAAGTHEHSHDHDHVHDQGKMQFSVGKPGKGKPDRVVSVSMRDNMQFVFEPALATLRDGETVEFRVTNDGKIRHEFSIGDAADQAEHAAMMRKMPDMVHDDPNTVSLEPGKSAILSWKFTGAELVVFACNIPGHFEAGMRHEVPIGKDESS